MNSNIVQYCRYETEIQRLNDLLKTERKNKEKLEQEKDESEERKRSTELKLQVSLKHFYCSFFIKPSVNQSLNHRFYQLSCHINHHEQVSELVPVTYLSLGAVMGTFRGAFGFKPRQRNSFLL